MEEEEERERKGGRERMDYRNEMEEMGCVTWSGGMVRGWKMVAVMIYGYIG